MKKARINPNLSQKFVLWFSLILAGLFLLVFLSVQFILIVAFEKPAYQKILAGQSETDNLTADIFNEATYIYSGLVTEANRTVFEQIMDASTSFEEAQEKFMQMLDNLSINEELFVNIALKAGDKLILQNDSTDFPQKSFLMSVLESQSGLYAGNNLSGCVVLGKKIDSRAVAVDDGVLVFFINEAVISHNLMLMAESEGSAFLVLPDYFVISSAEGQYTGKVLFDTEKLLPLNAKMPYTQVKRINGARQMVVISRAETINSRFALACYFVNIVPYNQAFSSFILLEVLIIVGTLLALAVAVIYAVFIANRLTQPLNRLNMSINNVILTGEKSFKPVAKRGDEIYQLEKSYEEMIERIFALMEKTKEDMDIQRKLELDALQMQMNTHFLFNTLDAIAWLSKIKKQPEIEGLVLNLAKFFRLTLHAGDKFIRIEEEIEIIKHFVEIEKVCYPDKFSIEYNIEPEIEAYMSLKMILQPIVENAIKHGLSEQNKLGKIVINAFGEDDNIIYEVIDNGLGFDTTQKPKKNSYGLKNINERIKLEYGSNYGLKLESTKGVGTKVIVKLAKRL